MYCAYRVWSEVVPRSASDNFEPYTQLESDRQDKKAAEGDAALITSITGRRAWVQDTSEIA